MSARDCLSSAVSGLEVIRIIGSRLSCSANTREAISSAVPLTMIARIDFTPSFLCARQAEKIVCGFPGHFVKLHQDS